MQDVQIQLEKTQERAEIRIEHCWNVEALYSSWQDWEVDLVQWGREGRIPHWPEIQALKDTWKQSAEQLKQLIQTYLEIDRHITKLYTYAHLRHDEDVAEEQAKKAYQRINFLHHAFRQETAWVEPELLLLSREQLDAFLLSPTLNEYTFYLEQILRLKDHTLEAHQEELLAMSGNSLQAASQAFRAFNNADLTFLSVEDSQGRKRELTHGKYSLYMRDQDRKLREGAFKNLHRSFLSFENTLCELLNGQIQNQLFHTRAHHYSSCLEAALFPNQIDVSVYHALIAAVRESLPSLHRYIKLRKESLNIGKIHVYDLQVPLVKNMQIEMEFEPACELVLDSLAPLGKDYQALLRRGLFEDRWVDRYENARKRSGAYSSGCYDSMPYILMNYHGTFNDIMTLTHEAGHSMHSFLSRLNQPYQYSHYSIFVAEVASTFHEELLSRYLLKNAKSKEEKIFLINQKLDTIRSTLLRQTCFAEFELKLHEWAEQGIPLTPALLKEEYLKLNQEYYGPDLILDEEVAIEWARIPHFYSNFYVYQYATGLSAALALAEEVLTKGEEAKQRYLNFLSAGNSQYPLDVLKMAGVDMRTKQPVQAAMRHFDALVTELAELLDSGG